LKREEEEREREEGGALAANHPDVEPGLAHWQEHTRRKFENASKE